MIAVRETKDGSFERITGNPVLTSLDGKVRAPLAVIMHESWTVEDRARFGIYLVEPVAVPDGKRAKGSPTYQRQGDAVVEVVEVEDIPAAPESTPQQKVEKLAMAFGVSLDELRSVILGGGKQ